jgi:hypothetical protein
MRQWGYPPVKNGGSGFDNWGYVRSFFGLGVIREASGLLQSSSTLCGLHSCPSGEHPKGALNSWNTGCRAFRPESWMHLTGTSVADRQLD